MNSHHEEAYVVFDHVQKTYDGNSLVVKDLNLVIKRGEFLTLLGPSGSGKTTSLMMLAGFEVATSGEIRVGGKDINRLPPHKRDIGFVFQNYALFPHMTVGENLAFPLEVRGVPKAEQALRVTKALEMVQMGQFASRRPGNLSGGQQQRVALARALIFNPALILMDEPLGALDKQLREHMQIEIKRLHDTLGITVVYVTHDQGEALAMSDRVAVFHEGRVQQISAPADIYERPENSFVAQFIGANNQLSGVIEESSGDRVMVRLSSGEVIGAVTASPLKRGDKTTISIRPERVEIGAAHPAEDWCRVKAEVLGVLYAGDMIRYQLKAAGNEEFSVKQRNGPGAAQLSVGHSVHIGWSAQDCRALDPVEAS